MTKTSRNLASAAEDSFQEHYATIWGQERWQNSLYPALAEQIRYAALFNQYALPADFWRCFEDADIVPDDLEQLEFPRCEEGETAEVNSIVCYARKTQSDREGDASTREVAGVPFPQPKHSIRHPTRVLTHWNMDAASILVASLLDVRPTDTVLDLCAAPGGKSLVLAQRMWPTAWAEPVKGDVDSATQVVARLVSNEADARRQKRLTANLHAYLPSQLTESGLVKTTHIDATQSGPGLNAILTPGGYDKVLIDAPCSTERHIIHAHLKAKAAGYAAPEMTNWRPSSVKRLAKTQLDLLMTGLKATRIGGKVIYATCSISTAENDGVIEKLLSALGKEKKKGSEWSVRLDFGDGDASTEHFGEGLEKWAERTKYGWIILPDHPSRGRWGPLFFAMLTKTSIAN